MVPLATWSGSCQRLVVPHVTIVRDLLLTALMVLFWIIEQSGARSVPVQVAAGVFTAIVGFLLHEWAHLAGARWTASQVLYPNRVLAPLLFHFDCKANGRSQFLAMSYGGYLGSLIGVGLILLLAPLDRLSGQVALGLAGVGMVVTLLAEVPTTLRVLRGGPLPTGYAFDPPK